jgi:hypothetical protein
VSGETQSAKIDLDIVKLGTGSGVSCGELLVSFVDAVLQGKTAAIATARSSIYDQLGEPAAHDAAAVISMFQLNTRVADACGIPLDTFGEESRRQLGVELGFDNHG